MQQMQIITTIADDLTESSKIKNFQLDNAKNIDNSVSTTVSESIQNELQSQIDTSSRVESISSDESKQVSNPQCNSSNNINNNNNKYMDMVNLNSINSLKIEFLIKFIYYLHNLQLFGSVENKLIKKSIFSRRHLDGKPSTTANLITHNQKCRCYEEMLSGYLILLDYIFNEKYIFNGSRLKFDDYFLKFSTPKSTYLNKNKLTLNLNNVKLSGNMSSIFEEEESKYI